MLRAGYTAVKKKQQHLCFHGAGIPDDRDKYQANKQSLCQGVIRAVLVSYCCSNKLPLTEWLKTAQIYCLRVLGVRSPKWGSLG